MFGIPKWLEDNLLSFEYSRKLHRKISRTLTYSEPEAYSKLRHINNPDIFRTLTYEAYSEPLQTSTMMRFAKIVNGYNCFHEL